ncbi:MAG: XdhC family protein [Thermoanaerobaculia bacterium]
MSLDLLDRLLAAREPIALCTVIRVKGSAPRHVGSWMLADAAGLVAGSVGGGGGEALVLDAAREALSAGTPRVLDVEKLGTEAEGPDMVCGGSALILVEPIGSMGAWAAAREVLSRGERALLARPVATGESAAMDRTGRWTPAPPAGVDADAALRALEHGRPHLDEAAGVFYDPLLPPERLLVLGGGHVGRAVAASAHAVGFAVTVADDRAEFLTPERYPADVKTFLGGYAEAVDVFPWDASAYAVIVTRGHLADLESLRAVLGKPWRYAGLIGSRRKVRLLTDQVLEDGFDPAKVAAVNAPIGLDIGAETPEELAVSIVGELVAARRGVAAASLSRRAPRNAS